MLLVLLSIYAGVGLVLYFLVLAQAAKDGDLAKVIFPAFVALLTCWPFLVVSAFADYLDARKKSKPSKCPGTCDWKVCGPAGRCKGGAGL